YTLGAAVRPLAFGRPEAAHRLSLFADVPWSADELKLPKVGLHFEPVNGVQARLGYDLESQSLGFSFSIAYSSVNGGTSFSTDTSMNVESGTAFVQFAPRPFNYPQSFSNELYFEYDLEPGVYEAPQGMRTGPFYFLINQNTLLSRLNELKEIADDPSINGLVLVNQHPQMSLSTMRELRDALLHFKSKGKKIFFYSNQMNTVEYSLAAATADKLYLHPLGKLDLRGLSASSPYFNNFFEKYGIEVENFNTGDYKTAYNFLSENSMPQAEREALEYMLQGMLDELTLVIEKGRGEKLNGSAQELIENGPYLKAEDALSAGLVDGLLQQDEFKDEIPNYIEKRGIRNNQPPKQIRREWSKPPSSRVAFIQAVGPIHTGKGDPVRNIGAETTAKALRAAREDTRVEAILLRINSSGGSALASDIIAREVELCRSGKNTKPVIVSMGSSAASGGYYISAFADKIIASPFTLTGSIGVITIFPNIADALQQHEIQWDVVKQGPQADFGALYRPLTEEERERVKEHIEHSYDRFLDIVSEGRTIPREEVETVAGGRVWTGVQARDRGLVDAIGGYREAIDILTEVLDTSKEIELINYSFADTWGIVSLEQQSIIADSLLNIRSQLSGSSQNHFKEFLPPEVANFYRYYRASAINDPHSSLLLMPYYVEGITAAGTINEK
ncbi:MAG: signal peptide peptidase SppA, partial [Spirochaetia bacterium]